jgi:hypothetical protein
VAVGPFSRALSAPVRMTEISSIRGHPIPPQWQLDTPHGIYVACRRVLGPEGRKSVAPAARGCCPNGGVANFPSSPRRGRCAINKKPRSILSSRRRGGDQSPEQFCWNLVTTPSAPERRLRDILWMSRPPLLGEEGKIADHCVSATAQRGRGP